MKNKKLIGIIVIAIITVVAIVTTVTLISSAKIDPFEYVNISFKGMDTMGELEFEIDYDYMFEEAIGPAPNGIGDYLEWEEQCYYLDEGTKITISQETDLSNGDEVQINFTFIGSAAEKFKDCSKNFIVSGLTPVEKVDVFSEIEIVFEGTSGDAYAKIIKKDGCSEFVKEISFYVSEEYDDYNLSNGDKIEIVADCDEKDAEKYGMVPQESSVFITVSGLGEYATFDILPKELFKEFANTFVKETQAQNDDEGYNAFTYSDVEIHGIYFGTQKEDSLANKENIVAILVKYDFYIDGQYSRTDYIPLVYEDIIINADKTVDVKYEDGSGTGLFYSSAENYLNKIYEDFDVTEIEIN